MSKRKLKDEIIILRPYGDTDLLVSVFSSKFWGLLISDKPIGIPLTKLILTFGVEMYSYSVRVFLRVNPGKRSGGWLLFLLTAGMMLSFNHVSIPWSIAPALTILYPFYFTLLFLFNDWPQGWPQDWFISIKSIPMQIFTILFCLRASIQIAGVLFFSMVNPHNDISRGDSLIYKVLPDKSKVEEEFVKVYVEPTLVFILGLILFKTVGELVLGKFLMIAAISLFIQEQYENAIKKLL